MVRRKSRGGSKILALIERDTFASSICLSSSDEDEAAKLLLDHGARVNSTNKKGATPLIIAAVKGHHSVLRILTNHPQIKLHEQVGPFCV